LIDKVNLWILTNKLRVCVLKFTCIQEWLDKDKNAMEHCWILQMNNSHVKNTINGIMTEWNNVIQGVSIQAELVDAYDGV
jgi:hypothetical protein